jgi:hypothetical protein
MGAFFASVILGTSVSDGSSADEKLCRDFSTQPQSKLFLLMENFFRFLLFCFVTKLPSNFFLEFITWD